MRAAGPTTRSAHSAFQLCESLLNPDNSRLRHFPRGNPTDPLVASERRNILPERQYRWGRGWGSFAGLPIIYVPYRWQPCSVWRACRTSSFWSLKKMATQSRRRGWLSYLNHSLRDFGHPTKSSSAKGAPQFAQRSTKSQMGIPIIGRSRAVQKPQKTIKRRIMRTGLKSMRRANVTSANPTRKSSCVAVLGSETPKCANQPIQSFFP